MNNPKTRLYPRHLSARLRAALADTPVVMVNGARQAGKSTLALQMIAEGYPATYLTLDDAVVLGAARADPSGFVESFQGPVVLDEVQHAPEVFPAIKAAVDRRRQPGRFLLTGSADVLLLPRISESLAGRTEILTIWPLSQSELAGRKDAFVDTVFSPELPPVSATGQLRSDVLRRALLGGYPEVIARADADRRRAWFGSYLSTILQRDIRQVADIAAMTEMPRLLSLLAARSMSILNMAEVSRAADVPHRSLVRYVALLETIFFVQRLPAWSRNIGRRLVRHPKVMLNDTGLLAHLIGAEADRFASDPTLAGPLLETFAAAEVVKAIGWSATQPRPHHFRTGSGDEVDLVLERGDGTIVGIEVKASSTVDERDFRGLRALAAATGRSFKRGIVLYTGRQSVPFGPSLHAVPMSALWAL